MNNLCFSWKKDRISNFKTIKKSETHFESQPKKFDFQNYLHWRPHQAATTSDCWWCDVRRYCEVEFRQLAWHLKTRELIQFISPLFLGHIACQYETYWLRWQDEVVYHQCYFWRWRPFHSEVEYRWSLHDLNVIKRNPFLLFTLDDFGYSQIYCAKQQDESVNCHPCFWRQYLRALREAPQQYLHNLKIA